MPDFPQQVRALVNRFDQNADEYERQQYNEAQLRAEFVNPLFRALGWDVDNLQGYSERYKDVVHEDSIKIAGATKAPDYCFRVGGTRKFFVEAKKPSINIKDDPYPAYQLRRYAWSSQLPLSILTNFREFAVYDCRRKPSQNDRPSAGRIEYFTYKQYHQKWGLLFDSFAKESVLRGSFDKYADSTKGKRGTEGVDRAFLGEIERWRDLLARHLATKNLHLSQPELNFSVQKTIDRIIFLRICEDRGIEPYGQLLSLTSGHESYKRLCDLYRKADYKYNSGLFHFDSEKDRQESLDGLSLTLHIDDKVLASIISSLYYPESPYEFSVFPADILGQVYEQFLGKVIRLTPTHQAKVDYKPEVKKAGGVYYTPTYVVSYIVGQILGKALDGMTPATAKKVKVLDPTCGSGSFLLGAYEYLLEWHRAWYEGNNPQAHQKQLYRGSKGDWKLTIEERKRILLDCIHGVDIDTQAVEVTKLSLLLKVLDGETEASISRQKALFHKERVLPDLGSNIKCGNSLIEQGFFSQGGLFEETSQSVVSINAFDWNREFSGVFRHGGFQVIIGNPPWGAEFDQFQLDYLRTRYATAVDRMVDSYIYFLYLATQLLSKEGQVGFIVPATLLNQVDARSIRGILLDQGLSAVVNLGKGIFGTKVLNTSCIIITQKKDKDRSVVVSDLSTLPLNARETALREPLPAQPFDRWAKAVQEDPHRTFFTGGLSEVALLLRLRKKFPSLRDVLDGDIQRGVTPDVVEAHVLSETQARKLNIEKEVLRPSISGTQIKRYGAWDPDQYIIYTTKSTNIKDIPNALAHLKQFKSLGSCPEVLQNKHPWWSLHRPRNSEIFDSPKFIGLTTAKTIQIIFDEGNSLCVTDAMYVFRVRIEFDPWAVMAILSSRPFLALYRIANQGEARVIPQVKASKLHDLPMPLLDAKAPELAILSKLCKQMTSLSAALARQRVPLKSEPLLRQMERLDAEIDLVVSGLYGLRQSESSIVTRLGV